MRRGSALLIVLGMVSFMVVSAVGFSIYMRESRVPSSHLRREATSRYLLKSALANAISRIDGELVDLEEEGFPRGSGTRVMGIQDDVYPGVPKNSSSSTDRDNGDLWLSRVFTPFGVCSPSETVATLTLEGLAYLPPAIINEARVFSRTTRTARWHSLSYDLGRYAFCAIDVSDCFDINKLYASGRRTSAAGERVNLSSLFPDNGSKLENILNKAGDVPFVSVADFNIAAGNTEFSPFYGYVGSTDGKIYTRGDAPAVSNALFITDTWFPETNDCLTAELERKSAVNTKGYNLAKAEDQPFNNFSAQSYMHVTDQTRFSRAGGLGLCNLGMVGLACLYDYLDHDSEPISYCLPCTETAPMVCGLGIIFQDSFKLTVNATKETRTGRHDTGRVDKESGDKIYEKVTANKCTLEIPAMNRIPVKTVLSFPFKRTGLRSGQTKFNPGDFKVKAVAKIFFAPPDLKCRLDANSPIYPATKADWNDGYRDGVLTVACNSFTGSFSPKDMPSNAEDTLFDLQGFFRINGASLPLYWKVSKSLESGTGSTTSPQQYYSRDDIASDANRLRIFKSDGTLDDDWSKAFDAAAAGHKMPEDGAEWKDADLPLVAKDDVAADLCGTEVVPHVVVWVRIEGKGGKVVDVVPACPADDVLWASRANVVTTGKSLQLCGEGRPVLEFRGTKQFTIGTKGEGALDGKDDPFLWKQIYAVDPRYNFAPENWFAVTGGDGDARKEEWVSSVVDGFLGQDGRDRDVFMFTSDQEYLQSIGELQFLPFVQSMDGSANAFNGDYLSKTSFEKTNENRSFAVRQVTSGGSISGLSFASKDFMWRSYCAYDRIGNAGWQNGWCNPYEPLDNAGNVIPVVTGTGDFRLNPFSSDRRIHLAAVKDTPYDYYVASTNDSFNGISPQADASDKCFGEDGSCESWDDRMVERMADSLRNAFRDVALDGIHDYTEAMYDLAWENANDRRLFNMSADMDDPLHSVDRKFLFSYWRECFQNRQQLFLVFLRAEPQTVGGSTGDALAASQLGARGVALVWRDPAPPVATSEQENGNVSRSSWREKFEAKGPHRTRVLFYHQFD